MHEYLCFEKIKGMTGGYIKVRCYFNGRWWVCPNPHDKDRSESLAQQFCEGVYIHCKDVYLTESEFADPTNWNS